MQRLVLSFVVILVVLAVPFVALGDAWSVDYYSAGAPQNKFYANGSYDFLLRNQDIPVYLRAGDQWQFIGLYRDFSPPSGMPAINTSGGFDQAVAYSTSGGSSLGAPDPLGGWLRPPIKLERGLQLGSAMIATAVLQAAGLSVNRFDTAITLPHVTVHVWWQCAGVTTVLLLVGLALSTRRYALVALALPLALVDNGLRIAVIGLVAEYGGVALAHGWHDWIGRGMLALASMPLLLLAKRTTR